MKIPEIPIEEYLNGEKLQALCDVDCEKNPGYESAIAGSRHPVLTVFCQTHELKNKMPFLRSIRDKVFILVTHNSDGGVHCYDTKRWFDYEWRNESNVAYWLSQNVDVAEPNVVPIPIGLENSYIFNRDVKMQRMFDLTRAKIEKQDRMFVCFNPGTNKKQRETAYHRYDGCSWAQCCVGQNNIQLVRQYFDEMIKCQFVLSPEGNGLDCIRTWEALYLGCIPIVKRRAFTDWYAQRLPIIVVNFWDEISLEFLLEKKKEFEQRTFDYDLLTVSYWRRKIAELKNALCVHDSP
jgi:hypothetical protein